MKVMQSAFFGPVLNGTITQKTSPATGRYLLIDFEVHRKKQNGMDFADQFPYGKLINQSLVATFSQGLYMSLPKSAIGFLDLPGVVCGPIPIRSV
jgi:hypothetical protein